MVAGITSVTFRGLSAEEIVKLAVSAKLTCIEWGADVHARPDNEAALDEIVRLSSVYGIESVSYGSYWRAGVQNEFSAKQVIAAAKRLGVKRIRVWSGTIPSADADKTAFGKLTADLKNFVELASRENLTVATEFHHGTYTDTAQSTRRLLDAVPGLKTYWQENPQISALDNYGELKALLPFVETIHTFVFDADLNRYPLSVAEERWHAYIGSVREESRKDIPFLLEFVKNDSKEQAVEDARQLQKWLEENR